MNKVEVTSGMTMSLDGFTAGPNQSFEKPFGDNFDADLLDRWMFAEPEKHKHKKEIDAILDAGAFIMGSNMFGPKDRRDKSEWKGWWGDNPPYHAPVFVLSTKERAPVEMRSEEHTSELQSPCNLVCRLLLEKKNTTHRLSKADGADLRLDVRYARGARLYIWFRRTAKNLV